MQSELIAAMNDEVHAIYRALTGTDMPESPRSDSDPEAEAEIPLDVITRRFAELEASARMVPGIAERLPPFSFTPSLDVSYNDDELLIEAVLPGIDRDDIKVEISGDLLTVSGVRRTNGHLSGRKYLHAEIARGPFHRNVRIPFAIQADPTIQLDRGWLQIHIKRAAAVASREQFTETEQDRGQTKS